MKLVLAGLVGLLAVSCTVRASELGLRILQSTDRAVTIGTQAFSVTVHSSGRIDALQAGGINYVAFIALYTSLSSFDTDNTVRAVQGEGGRGIGPLPDAVSAEKRGDRYFIAIKRTAARQEICGGRPLYHLDETVEVAPNGVLRVRYEFAWLRFFAIGKPAVYVALTGDTFRDLTFWADYTTHCQRGTFGGGNGYATFEQLRGPLRALRVDCPSGPFDIWIYTDGSVTSARWGEQYSSLGLHVPKATGTVYSGVASVVEFVIKVPLPGTEQGGVE